MRIAVRPCHSVGPHQQVPSHCTGSITERKDSAIRIEKRLVEGAIAASKTQHDHRSVASGVQDGSAEFRKIQGG